MRVLFDKPTPFWADAFVGVRGMIIPKHLYADYIGAKSRDAPANLKPVGTGPYKFVDFKPGDMVRGEINNDYHMPNRPYFDTIEMKGGGDAISAARAVLQTGEFDFAWNLQVEDEILLRLEKGGKGTTPMAFGGNIEHIQLNTTDPWTEVDGERASMKTKHPTLDRQGGASGAGSPDRPEVGAGAHLRPHRRCHRQLRQQPGEVRLEEHQVGVQRRQGEQDPRRRPAGSAVPDGIREKDGKKLKFVYQTSINTPRQKTQAIVKQACQKAGIDIEVKAVTASVFFSSDVANPDTYPHFYCDLQMYTTTMTQPDPETFLLQFVSWEVATKENKWQGRNITRWTNKEADEAFKASQAELDPVKRAAHFIKINDLACNDHAVIPVVYRPTVQALSSKLRGATASGWDSNFWDLHNWYKEG